MKTKKHIVIWIVTALVVLVTLATVFVVEFVGKGKGGEEQPLDRFPEDALEAAVKLNQAGYVVKSHTGDQELTALENDAYMVYGVTFTGRLTGYIEVYSADETQLMAEIMYFEHNADAKILYNAIRSNWSAERDEGEIRYKGKTVYMGLPEALDALDK